ncbi:MAG: hypothetical protein WC211_03810 [Dehalococcoidia bacterium]
MGEKYGEGYCGRLIEPLRKVRGWRLWAAGVRDAIDQRGHIGYGRTLSEWDEQEDYDRGLCVGEWIARRVWG